MIIFIKENTNLGMRKEAVTSSMLHMNWIIGLTYSFSYFTSRKKGIFTGETVIQVFLLFQNFMFCLLDE